MKITILLLSIVFVSWIFAIYLASKIGKANKRHDEIFKNELKKRDHEREDN